MRNWSSQMLRNLLTVTQKRNWRAAVQPLSYQALKSLLFRIRSAGKEFSIIQICCQAALSMPMEGWGWQLGQVHWVNKNLDICTVNPWVKGVACHTHLLNTKQSDWDSVTFCPAPHLLPSSPCPSLHQSQSLKTESAYLNQWLLHMFGPWIMSSGRYVMLFHSAQHFHSQSLSGMPVVLISGRRPGFMAYLNMPLSQSPLPIHLCCYHSSSEPS